MPDSLQAGLNPRISSDTLQAKVLLYSKDAAESDSLATVWMPVICVFLGAAVTLTAQWLMKKYEDKQQVKKEILACKNGLRANLNLLYFLLKDLAYLKCDTSLQVYYSVNDTTPEAKKKALDEVYNNYKYLSEKQVSIYALFAEMSNHFTNYYALHGTAYPDDVASSLKELQQKLLNLEKSAVFPGPLAEVHDKCSAEILKLSMTYHKHLEKLQAHIAAI